MSSSSATTFALLLLLVATTTCCSCVVDAQDTTLPPPPTEYGFDFPNKILGINQVVRICSPTTGSKICYRNWLGSFYYDCTAGSDPIVRLYKCEDWQCTTDCSIQQNFTKAVPVPSIHEANKKYNWSGVFHPITSGYVSEYIYENDNASAYCNSTQLKVALHHPAGDSASNGPCLRWGTIEYASKRWYCTAGATTAVRLDFLYQFDCAGISTPNENPSGECVEDFSRRWVCNNGTSLNVIVFERGLSAGRISAWVCIAVAVFLLLLMLLQI